MVKLSYLVVQRPKVGADEREFVYGYIEGMSEDEAQNIQDDDEVVSVQKVSDLMKYYQQYPGWADAKVTQVCNHCINSIGNREGIGSRGLR